VSTFSNGRDDFSFVTLIFRRDAASPPPVLAVPINLSLSHPSDVLDMPVDPNEPTYCLCHQVSYGEMIGCDNPDVRHFFW
jgi:hypothetical protein